LYPAGGKSTANFFPQQRRQIESNQIIKSPARLLGVDHIDGQFAWMFDGVINGALGDFVKNHPSDTLVL